MALTTYSSSDVCEITGVTYRNLDYWVRLGILGPMTEGYGSGVPRVWMQRDVECIAVVKTLRDAGVDLQATGRVGDYVRQHGVRGSYRLGPGIVIDLDEIADHLDLDV